MRRPAVLLAVLFPVISLLLLAEDPPCLGPDAVRVRPDDPTSGWLTRESAQEVKRRFETLFGGIPHRWEGDTLVLTCDLMGDTREYRCVTVAASGGLVEIARGGKAMFSDIAARSGHTQQEADVLARRYAHIEKAYYREVPNEEGGWISEDELIIRREKRALGISDDASGNFLDEGTEARGEALAKQIEAAQDRGDTEEVMRLALAAQPGNAHVAKQAAAATEKIYKEQWLLLERSIGPLTEAAYPTAVSKETPCPCSPPLRWPK